MTSRPGDRRRAAERRRLARPDDVGPVVRRAIPDPARGARLPHDHPGGRGACTPACPAWHDQEHG